MTPTARTQSTRREREQYDFVYSDAKNWDRSEQRHAPSTRCTKSGIVTKDSLFERAQARA